jgi:quercetin dioxygenase-like cupin family protein
MKTTILSLIFTMLSMAAPAQDPATTSPKYYKVLLENDQVRVLEWRLKPGEKEAMHSHPAGVVYELTASKLRITFPDGKTQEASGAAGETFWRGPTTHAIENIGDTEAHAIAIDVKTAAQR